MKKILIVINNYGMGGTVTSLCALLSKIDTQKVIVDVFVRDHSGPLAGNLLNCTILPENLWLSHNIYNSGILVKTINFILLCIRKIFEMINVDVFRIYNYIGGKKICTEKYDAVIGFSESLSRYISFIPARQRIIWVHCDYRRYAKGIDETKYYDRIDKIVCVSEFAKKIFCEYYPKYIKKVLCIHNIINEEELYIKSSYHIDDSRFDNNSFTIVSCGRFDSVKQFQLIPSIVDKVLKLTDRPFKWYIIGDGAIDVKNQIQQEINHYKVSNYICCLGMKTNPYPYMAKSNLYVCTSLSESYPMVVNEAKTLKVPVLCNTFPSAIESVQNGIDGYILDIEKMPPVIANMIENPMKIMKSKSENDTILNQIYEIL